MAQVDDKSLIIRHNQESNSIATVVKHLWGNMLSRWTDLLTSDGEKEWRERDLEFENDLSSRGEINEKWDEGWKCLFEALNGLSDKDLDQLVYIRNQGHTVGEAIFRQLAHYAYHVGQIVLLCKMYSTNWHTLSISRGDSKKYNYDKFEKKRRKQHFSQEFIKKNDKS